MAIDSCLAAHLRSKMRRPCVGVKHHKTLLYSRLGACFPAAV